MNKKVSIIIPCITIDSMTEKCIKKCLELNYSNFEVIVITDEKEKEKFKDKRLKTLISGPVKPALKRNIAIKEAKGEFFAFIDSDAYPEKNWLKNAIKYFENKKIGIVGGPNLTPPRVNFWEKVSGHTLANYFVSSSAAIRYRIAENRFTSELPSCNYIARKEASSEYDPNFLTAEDSEFCFTCKKKGYKILYAGNVVVYHHRRDSLSKHMKQMWIYGRDIAWLSKKDFSFDKIYYSILTLFVLGFTGLGIWSIFNEIARIFFLANVMFYFLFMFFTSMHKNLKMSLAVFMASILTHFAYGLGWLYAMIVPHKKVE